jgi:hypothetical protein
LPGLWGRSPQCPWSNRRWQVVSAPSVRQRPQTVRGSRPRNSGQPRRESRPGCRRSLEWGRQPLMPLGARCSRLLGRERCGWG